MLFLGWFITTVVADAVPDVAADVGCGDARANADPCAVQEDAFAIMLPFVFSGVADSGEEPQDLPTVTTPESTPELTAVMTPQPSAQPTTTPLNTTPGTTTPSSPTSSIPPTAEATSGATATVDPAVTPGATSIATATLMPNPTQSPTSEPPLFSDPPIVAALVQQGNELSVSWSGCQAATSARVLYGRTGSRPDEMATTERALLTPSLPNAGAYQVIVECYDEWGNSVFSAPNMVEVIEQAVTQ